MSCQVEGIIHVMGEPDTGKTTFAYTADTHPDKIAFIDNDIKSKGLHKQLHFGYYLNAVKEFVDGGRLKPIDFHNMIIDRVKALPDGKFELLVFDNWTQMEDGINAYADEHMLEMSNLSRNQLQSMSMLAWPYKRLYYATVLDFLLTKAPTVIITTHVKDQWLNKRKTGAKIPRCQEPLIEKSSLRVWLKHNPDSQAPVGLVIKRITRSEWDGHRIKPIPVLPRRVAPCTWEKIDWYLEHPIGDRELTVDEIPNEDELAILDGVLTDDQKMMLRMAIDDESDDEPTEVQTSTISAPRVASSDDTDRQAIVMAMKEEGMSNMEIAKNMGLSIGEVRRMLK